MSEPSTVVATWLDGDRFELGVRGHRVIVDQPLDDGGADTGPSPTELFVAALAGCVAFYARRYLLRRDLPTEGLAVRTSYEMAKTPARVGAVELIIEVPAGVPHDHVERLLAVASHCTVHNTLTHAPDVDVRLAAPVRS
jgi:putative redox protein